MTVFKGTFPGNALIKSITIYMIMPISHRQWENWAYNVTAVNYSLNNEQESQREDWIKMLWGDIAVTDASVVCPNYATCNNGREVSCIGMMSRTRGYYHTEIKRAKEQATDLQLTKCSIVLLWVFISDQLFKIFPTFYRTQRFITMFRTTCHWAAASWIQFTLHILFLYNPHMYV
jgi:hypothetical protein